MVALRLRKYVEAYRSSMPSITNLPTKAKSLFNTSLIKMLCSHKTPTQLVGPWPFYLFLC